MQGRREWVRVPVKTFFFSGFTKLGADGLKVFELITEGGLTTVKKHNLIKKISCFYRVVLLTVVNLQHNGMHNNKEFCVLHVQSNTTIIHLSVQ